MAGEWEGRRSVPRLFFATKKKLSKKGQAEVALAVVALCGRCGGSAPRTASVAASFFSFAQTTLAVPVTDSLFVQMADDDQVVLQSQDGQDFKVEVKGEKLWAFSRDEVC